MYTILDQKMLLGPFIHCTKNQVAVQASADASFGCKFLQAAFWAADFPQIVHSWLFLDIQIASYLLLIPCPILNDMENWVFVLTIKSVSWSSTPFIYIYFLLSIPSTAFLQNWSIMGEGEVISGWSTAFSFCLPVFNYPWRQQCSSIVWSFVP